MSAEWYYHDGTNAHGPLSSHQLAELAARGSLRPDYRVRKGSEGKWHLASQVRGLTFASPGQPPPVIEATQASPPPLPAHHEPAAQSIVGPVADQSSRGITVIQPVAIYRGPSTGFAGQAVQHFRRLARPPMRPYFIAGACVVAVIAIAALGVMVGRLSRPGDQNSQQQVAQSDNPHKETAPTPDGATKKADSSAVTVAKERGSPGFVFDLENDYLLVAGIVPDGAAARAGNLRVGDRIFAISKSDSDEMTAVAGLNLEQAVSLLSGPVGTEVRLRVIARFSQDVRLCKLTRAPLTQSEVDVNSIEKPVRTLPEHFASLSHKRFRGRSLPQEMIEQFDGSPRHYTLVSNHQEIEAFPDRFQGKRLAFFMWIGGFPEFMSEEDNRLILDNCDSLPLSVFHSDALLEAIVRNSPHQHDSMVVHFRMCTDAKSGKPYGHVEEIMFLDPGKPDVDRPLVGDVEKFERVAKMRKALLEKVQKVVKGIKSGEVHVPTGLEAHQVLANTGSDFSFKGFDDGITHSLALWRAMSMFALMSATAAATGNEEPELMKLFMNPWDENSTRP